MILSVQKQIKALFQKLLVVHQQLEPSFKRYAAQQQFYNASSLQQHIHFISQLFDSYQQKVYIYFNKKIISSDYSILEKQLQLQEADIRNHIRIEQQYKLFAESVQSQLQQCEKSKLQLQVHYKQKIQEISKKFQSMINQNNNNILKQSNLPNAEISFGQLNSKLVVDHQNKINQRNQMLNRNRKPIRKFKQVVPLDNNYILNNSNNLNSGFCNHLYRQSKYISTYNDQQMIGKDHIMNTQYIAPNHYW